ncbi:MAG: DNA topoisomerase I [Candidatus Thorarchaeota archaeon]|nr:MAG: DNA topoisomerase I [Candidatus Thorarchaeota archaeon]
METLWHNGILVLRSPEPHGIHILVRGKEVSLTPLQEEMAMAWVRKLGTPYVEDPVFKSNFLKDFSKALGVRPVLTLDEIDFSVAIDIVEEERARKETMTKEEKKAAREKRKEERERLKEKYGYAEVDGERMELGNYQTEPSGIFMGRGKHPLRGRWKQGASEKDITLNLSPDAPRPEGDWLEIIWASDTMWIAKWTDELTGKTKYIWLHDSTPIKQQREEDKFDKARRLGRKTEEIRAHIMDGLQSADAKRRMIAAACYLIDTLSLRVGDEKDPDEADTVGATTLRTDHLTFEGGRLIFDFLGKDSVAWHKELELSDEVFAVFRELYHKAVERLESFESRGSRKTRGDPRKLAQIFPSVRSTDVNRFLSEVDRDLTAKVFRTFHATKTMEDELKKKRVKRVDPDFIKKAAFKRANLEVARVMNHTKQAPKGWPRTEERYQERLKKADARIAKAKDNLAAKRKQFRARKKTETKNLASRKEVVLRQRAAVENNMQSVRSWRERRDKAKAAWDRARDQKRRIRASRRKAQMTKKERLEDSQERIDRTRLALERAEEGLRRARERHAKSKAALEKKQLLLSQFREKSEERLSKAKAPVDTAMERVKNAELAKEKIRTDYQIAEESRTLNLGTSLKAYIHPRVVYKWCQRVEYDWRKVYPKTLQRKFAWVEN